MSSRVSRMPSVGGGRDQRLAHGVGVVVGAAVGLVVEVVELPDGGDPGQRHLGVHGAGQRVVAVRGEGGGEAVHGLAPGPEGAGADLDGGAQRAVEGVRVGVGEAGQGEAGQPDGAGRGRGDPGADGEEVSGRDGAGGPGAVAQFLVEGTGPGASGGTRSTTTPLSTRSPSQACSSQ